MAVNKFDERVTRKKGLTKIEVQCWIQLQDELNQNSYNRIISKFAKNIKNTIFELRERNNDCFEYFVDVDIRNSPSTTAFLSLQISLFKDTNIVQLKEYPLIIKNKIEHCDDFEVFLNNKKRKT